MTCGLPPPSSLMLTPAFRVPVALGLNVTVIVQLALAAMLVPQVLVSKKSALFRPVRLIPVKFNCVVPTFVRVTFWGALVVPTVWSPKTNRDFDSETTVPVPLNGIACGLAGSEPLTPKPACLRFLADGVKVAEIVQLAPAASEAAQGLVSAKSPGFKPPMKILLMVSVPEPLFVQISFLGGLGWAINCVVKARFIRERVTNDCAVGVDLGHNRVGHPMIRSLEGILGRKVGRASVSSNVGITSRVNGDACADVRGAPAQVSRVNQRAAVGIELGHKRIFRTAEGGLNGILDRKVGRGSLSSNVGIARRVHGDTIADVSAAPTQVSRVNEGTAVAIELGHEGLIVSVSRGL